ncbi:glycosyltransferase family 4 protein [Candidatus Uhrbacteria bacterium]|nr:glycosyltransferase family 4 protein [Candidatus Uhrbacteria bacterium]
MNRILLAALEYPPMVGGVGEYYRGLVDASEGKIIPFVGEEKLYWGFFPRWLPMLWRILREMKRHKASIIFAGEVLPVGEAVWFIDLLVYWFNDLIPGFRYGIFAHGLDLALNGRKRWIAKKVMQRATWVITNSEYTKKIVLEYGIDKEKITVLTPCPSATVIAAVRHSGSSVESRDPSAFPQDDATTWRLLTIARFVERKGYDAAVSVAAELKKQGKKFHWTFVGDGPDRRRIEVLADQLDVHDVIRFEPSASVERLAQFYRAADCFVFLPRELPNGDVEGFGMVCLEAALYGLPVVAARSGGVPEAVEDGGTGVLTSPTDIKKIVQDIIDLLNDSDRMNTMGATGRERVLREFQWTQRVQKLSRILERTGGAL